EAALSVVMAERAPQSRRLDEQFDPDLALEFLVLDGGLVAGNGVGDVGGDVEGGSPGRPVARAFLAADRPPGKGGPAQAQLSCPFAREVERGVPPAERVGGRFRRG